MCMHQLRKVLAPVAQSGSGATLLGSGSNVSRASRVSLGDIRQGGTMERGKGHRNVDERQPLQHQGNHELLL
jgi:hypothetical protein